MSISGVKEESPYSRPETLNSQQDQEIEELRRKLSETPQNKRVPVLSNLIHLASHLTASLGWNRLTEILKSSAYYQVVTESVSTQSAVQPIFHSTYEKSDVSQRFHQHHISIQSNKDSNMPASLSIQPALLEKDLLGPYSIPEGKLSFFKFAEDLHENWGLMNKGMVEAILQKSDSNKAFLLRFDQVENCYVISEKEDSLFRHILIDAELDWSADELETYLSSTQDAGYKLIIPDEAIKLFIPKVQDDHTYVIESK